MNEIVEIVATLLFLVRPGGGISSPLAYSGVAHNGGGGGCCLGIELLLPLVGDSHTVNRNKVEEVEEWAVCVLQKSTPQRVCYNWVVDCG